MSDDAEVVEAPAGFADGSAFEDAPEPAAGVVTETPPEEAPAAEVPAEPEPVAAAPVVSPAAPRAPDPQTGILRDLQAERLARQTAQQEVALLKGRLEGLEMAQRRGPAQVDAPQERSPQDTQRLTTFAHRFGLYDTNGQPDLPATSAMLNDLKAEFTGATESTVTARLQPVVDALQHAHQQTALSQAQQHKQQIMAVGVQSGADAAVLEQYIDGVIQVQPGSLADPQVAVGLIALARGMTGLATPQTPTPTAPTAPVVAPTPNFSERPGQRVAQPKALAGIERVIATKRGINAETWNKNSSDFEDRMSSGRGLVAED